MTKRRTVLVAASGVAAGAALAGCGSGGSSARWNSPGSGDGSGGPSASSLADTAITVLRSGGTYGVGQPLIVAFGKAPADKDAALKALNVTIKPEVEIRWRWVDSATVHGRPEKYWASGTKITFNANVYGVNLGKG